MLTNAQNALLNSTERIADNGNDINFWNEAQAFCDRETAKFGLSPVTVVSSAREPRGKYAHYEPWSKRCVIFYITSRDSRFLFNSVMHELAHHIHHGLRQQARVRRDYSEAKRLDKGGRVHGLGFKEIMTELEHENAPEVPHSPWGQAGCRGVSRLSSKDWAQRYTEKVCEKMTAATATKATTKKTATKTPAVKAPVEIPTFEVSITIESAFNAMSKGIIYGAQTLQIFATAKDEVTAKNKALRSFGLFHRNDVKYSVSAKPAKAPRAAAYAPSK
jgi:hypothetical protein